MPTHFLKLLPGALLSALFLAAIGGCKRDAPAKDHPDRQPADSAAPAQPGGVPASWDSAAGAPRPDLTGDQARQAETWSSQLGRADEDAFNQRANTDPFFFTAGSFLDTVEYSLRPSMLSCRFAVADWYLPHLAAAGTRKASWVGSLARDSILTRIGCAEFTPDRRLYGFYPAADGKTGAWKAIDLAYRIHLDMKEGASLKVVPFTAPEGSPQPLLFASTTDPDFARADIPLSGGTAPTFPETGIDTLAASLTFEKEIPGAAGPWFKSLRLVHHYRRDRLDDDAPGEEGDSLSSRQLYASMAATPLEGSQDLDFVDLGPDDFNYRIGFREGSRLWVSDFDGDGRPDILMRAAEGGCVIYPIRAGGPAIAIPLEMAPEMEEEGC